MAKLTQAVLAVFVASVALEEARGCTYSSQRDELGNIVAARSMEYTQGLFSNGALDLVSNISYYPAGTFELPVLIGNDPNGKAPYAHNVTNLYGFVQIDSRSAPAFPGLLLDHGVSSDGMNDQGLIVSALVLQASKYESPGIRDISVTNLDFVAYALGNFRDVEEVRAALTGKRRSVAITGCAGAYWSPGLVQMCDKVQSVHWAVEDKTGASVVIEFPNGVPKIYNNSVGTLTNDPEFPFMMQNLMQYQSISFQAADPAMAQVMSSEGVPALKSVGFNQVGIPGDASPISRFVRAYMNREISVQNAKPKTLEQVMALQQAVINSVFLPFGSVPGHHEGAFDYTVYTTMKIPSTCTFAYRTYKDMTWKSFNVCDPALQNVTAPIHNSMMPSDRSNPLGMVSIQDEFIE